MQNEKNRLFFPCVILQILQINTHILIFLPNYRIISGEKLAIICEIISNFWDNFCLVCTLYKDTCFYLRKIPQFYYCVFVANDYNNTCQGDNTKVKIPVHFPLF